jgi:hypothetical protein
MQDDRNPFDITFFNRAIRTSVGSALRSRYHPARPMPNRLFMLMMQLNEPVDSVTNEQPGRQISAQRDKRFGR